MDAHKTLIVFIQGVGALLLLSLVECQIISSPDSQTTCSGKDVDLEWVYGNPNDFASVTWTYINSSLVETTIMEQSVGGGAAQALNNFSVEHHGNGAITLKNVDTGKSGSYKISVAYLSSSPVDNTVSVTVNDCSSCKCDCEGCKTRVGICISFSCIGIAPEVIFVVGLLIASFRKTNLVVFAAIVIVIEIISGGVCISVPAEKCCTECCENWYKPLSIVFAVVSFLVGVAGIAEFVLVLSNRIGPGRNGGNGFFCFNNGNDDGNDGGNDSGNNGHHRGRGTNSSTVHTERTDTHRGTLSDRANSDGEVSRKDVHVQENRDNFSGRPMPPIPPLTDKKGRGLSANYDDDHPMTSVGIPDKKAGQLVPLKEQEEQKKKEESKKRRKRKKKAVSDDDDDDDVV